jgi:hypothetical protein
MKSLQAETASFKPARASRVIPPGARQRHQISNLMPFHGKRRGLPP